jgi:hypothetical protein
MNTVIIALISAFSITMAPLLLSNLNNRQRRAEKIEDYTRQDQVAAKAAEAAHLLLAENRRVAASAAQTHAQLSQIHVLVNSNMTAAMQGQLVALKGQLVLMERLAERTVSSVDELAAIAAVEAQIAELEANLRDRLQATDVAQDERERQEEQE